MDKDDNSSPEIWHFWVGQIQGLIQVKTPQKAEWWIWPDKSSKIDVFVIVFTDYPGNASRLLLGQQWQHHLIIVGDLRPPWAWCGPPLCHGWPDSKHAGIGEDIGGPSLLGKDIIHLRWVRFAFKGELAIVIDYIPWRGCSFGGRWGGCFWNLNSSSHCCGIFQFLFWTQPAWAFRSAIFTDLYIHDRSLSYLHIQNSIEK